MKIIITGGAGFVGSNLANYFLGRGDAVLIIDNFSRLGSKANLQWLEGNHPNLQTSRCDIRDYASLVDLMKVHKDVDVILHLAAQVAVTTSIADPREDFEVNALGTLNLLEAIRAAAIRPILIYTSTNKVYGSLGSGKLVETQTRYEFAENTHGINEAQPLDFHSPYGCSKGTADQYVLDYHRVYGVRSVVFRMSCIYGPRQFGIEDQGWIAWFLIASELGLSITVYGDGKQVRDVLYIDDLIQAFDLCIQNIRTTEGNVYNIGGGPDNTLSVWKEFGPVLGNLLGREPRVVHAKARLGDQLLYVSDIRKAARDFNWRPRVGVHTGIGYLMDWIRNQRALFRFLDPTSS